jgi:protein-disulfide isomerase
MDRVPETSLHRMIVPGAILLAGLLLAAAVYEYRAPLDLSFLNGGPPPSRLSVFEPPSPKDHVFGNPGAPIKVIEYCDIDAPYCKQFQSVMDSIMATYGESGQVAWVYRQFPITDVDVNALKNAAAAECAAKAGGDAGFFAFVDGVAAAAPGTRAFDSSTAAKVATAGIPTGTFTDCMATNNPEITNLYEKAVTAGATGAPYLILVTAGKTPNAIAGAFSYDTMKAIIEKARAAEGLH